MKLSLPSGSKRDVRAQFAVIAYRIVDGKTKVCLITSRRTGRWIVPKGWPMARTSAAKAVSIEAFEEAGLKGNVHPDSLGLFAYEKRIVKKVSYPIIAFVYAMEVTKVMNTWPEAHQRKRKWFSPKKAAKKLSDEGLAQIVAAFDPDTL